MTRTDKPAQRPGNPNFSCGPCAKRPGWTPDVLRLGAARPLAPVGGGRGAAEAGHRPGRTRCSSCRPTTGSPSCPAPTPAPSRWRCGPCSARAASTCWRWEDFGKRWVADIVAQSCKLADTRAARGRLRPAAGLAAVDFDRDVVFTWNGTASGVRVPDGDWIAAGPPRPHVRRCDLGVFAQAVDWAKVDVRDLLLAEGRRRRSGARHAGAVAARRGAPRELCAAAGRCRSCSASPTMAGCMRTIFDGVTINTPSMLCVEDYLDALGWAESVGGLSRIAARAPMRNAKVLLRLDRAHAVDRQSRRRSGDAVEHVRLPALRGPGVGRARARGGSPRIADRIAALLDAEGVAKDIGAYRTAAAGLADLVRRHHRAAPTWKRSRPGSIGLTARHGRERLTRRRSAGVRATGHNSDVNRPHSSGYADGPLEAETI